METVKNTEIFPADRVEEAARRIREGGLVAFPTETVYGLGCDGTDPAAVAAVYAAKGRPADNPLILHIADREMLESVALEITGKARALAEAFWPGPLTLVFRRHPSVPDAVTGGLDSVAVRMPDHPLARALIRAVRRPLAAPSANRSGQPSPTRPEHVLEDLGGRIDGILWGGPCRVGVESTILDVRGLDPCVLRPGGVPLEEIEKITGPLRRDPCVRGAEAPARPQAPGMKYRHYAPQVPLRLWEDDPEALAGFLPEEAARDPRARIGVLCSRELAVRLGPLVPGTVSHLEVCGSRARPEEMARALYGCLRSLDGQGLSVVYVETIPETGMGLAVMNRLRKAAGGGRETEGT